MKIKQFPEPGKHLIRYTGDTMEFQVQLTGRIGTGKAFLCTNLGNAALRRAEIIEEVEERITAGGADWSDIPMQKINDYTFAIRLSLTEPGHFECKCSFVPDDGSETVWAEGHNVHINVEPAAYCCSNSVYCAFVRQFGENKNKPVSTLAEGITPDELLKFDDNGYALIPGSGTFRDLIGELDHIVNHLKCRIIHLLPVNPTPTVYGRMGRFGSPYASLDFTAIDPSLAEFDRKATPLDQFIELADEIHKRDAKLFIDIAINHTGWAAKLHETHPDWLVREADGTIHSPGAWGVTWGDLTELDHSKLELWKYLADVFLVWCRRGVDGFRCDAGYMIPAPAWEYISARVRQEFPETIFLLEGLGGDPAVTRKLLDQANLNWAYSELFQNYSRDQIEGYLRYAWSESSGNGLMIHYAETHDNNRLAATSKAYASMRTALSALSSVSGAFGFANGVEWFATQKIDVHEASALNWGASENQNSLIKRLNLILALHPAFRNGAMMEFVDCGGVNAILFGRADGAGNNLLVAVNLDCERTATLEWGASYTPAFSAAASVVDLISGKNVPLTRGPEGKLRLVLGAAKFMCLSCGRVWLDKITAAETDYDLAIDLLTMQEARTVALQMIAWRRHSAVLDMDFDHSAAAALLLQSPEQFMQKLVQNTGGYPFVHWRFPEDLNRDVMLPPDFALFATAPHRFRCRILDEKGEKVLARAIAMKDESGRYFVLIPPLPETNSPRRLIFQIRSYEQERSDAGSSVLVLLPADIQNAAIRFNRNAIYGRSRAFMQANGRGALIHQRMEMEKLQSRYDAILLANLSPDYPEDRHIMWRRIRVWVLWHARRQEVKHEHLHSFHLAADGGGVWEYHVPVGTGLFLELCIKMEIVQGENAVIVTVYRHSCQAPKRLPDNVPVQIIIRPDIEDRNFHYNTKAAQGPEHYWKDQITELDRGFEFAPAPDRILSMTCSEGSFKRKDEWLYMNWMENEASRGLDPNSDLFSPGAFRFSLLGNDTAYIVGQILTSRTQKKILPVREDYDPFRCINGSIEQIALRSLGEFVVKRDDLKTVIAGYPWFLDWGRDTLIAARGLIAAPQFRDDVKKILIQFARFEENGTIPNMISGNNAANRDTSDAPLWLFVAVADLCKVEGNFDFLETPVREGQTFRQVLERLAEGLIAGTKNGISVDPESFLVFSPPHFTWMDTNYPAGTPREGYPVEIQALWFAALNFLAKVTDAPLWQERAAQVRLSILKFFKLPGKPYLSDCLHCSRGVPAAKAVADDHLRSNQLLAITLGAVKDKKQATDILEACSALLVPGAIRSLADQNTEYALPVYGADGRCLNNPNHPYFGTYEGDEDTRRKPAYHNGTAWTWPFPSFPEAYYMVHGEEGRKTARAYLASMISLMDGGCIAQLPEIIDGNAPHKPRGCDAQAWGMSEFYRVWKLLHR